MTRNAPNDHQPSTASPFHRLLAAHAVSQVGSGVTALALPLIAAVTLGATPFQVGLLAASETVPLLLLGLLAGVWVDRRKRRPLMVAADLGRFALLMLIPLGAWQGWLTFPLLLGVMGEASAPTTAPTSASASAG